MIRQFFASMSERWITVLTLIFTVAFVAVLSTSFAWCQATAAVTGWLAIRRVRS